VTSVNATLVKMSDGKSLKELEQSIIQQFTLLPTMEDKTNLINKLLGLPHVELVALVESHSVRLYFLSSTLEALRALRSLIESGQLKMRIESIFNYLLTLRGDGPVFVTHVDLLDFVKCEDYFVNGKIE